MALTFYWPNSLINRLSPVNYVLASTWTVADLLTKLVVRIPSGVVNKTTQGSTLAFISLPVYAEID